MHRAPPNVVVFLTDQQRWDTCGLHGNPLGLTPNHDRFARQGTHAPRAFTCQPLCSPARSCIQTGLYATASGCWRNKIPLRATARTIAHAFAEGGYSTGYIGKWHLGTDEIGAVPKAGRGGYEHWLASNILEMTSDAYDCRLYDEDDREVRLPGYRVDAITDADSPSVPPAAFSATRSVSITASSAAFTRRWLAGSSRNHTYQTATHASPLAPANRNIHRHPMAATIQGRTSSERAAPTRAPE